MRVPHEVQGFISWCLRCIPSAVQISHALWRICATEHCNCKSAAWLFAWNYGGWSLKMSSPVFFFSLVKGNCLWIHAAFLHNLMKNLPAAVFVYSWTDLHRACWNRTNSKLVLTSNYSCLFLSVVYPSWALFRFPQSTSPARARPFLAFLLFFGAP